MLPSKEETMFYVVKKQLAVYICLKKDFFYFLITSTVVVKFYFDGCFFYNLFASCVQVFHIISVIYTLFFNKEPLYRELEAEI